MLSAAAARDLRQYLAGEDLSCTEEDLFCYTYDAAVRGAVPDVVVYPRERDQVIELIRFAHRRRIPVVPRGAGTGSVGGALCARGGILVSFERMNHILSVDPGLRIGVVEPGVITADFQRTVERKGLFYPPDPSSARMCTLGGNVGHGAGGLRGLRYGTTKDYVIGLEAVTADGHLLRSGHFASPESHDLTGLLVGSEGTLACIVTIAVRLLPALESVSTVLLVFSDAGGALRASREILGLGILPVALEYMDHRALRCIREHGCSDLPPQDGHVLIVELCGNKRQVRRETVSVEKLAESVGATFVRTAWDPDQRRDVWSVRRALSPSMAHAARRKMAQDVCVPPSAVGRLLEQIGQIAGNRGLTIIAFGHLGDGNIHVNIMNDGGPGEENRAQAAVEEIYRTVLSLEGTLTGEHGIGLYRMPYLSWELTSQTLEAHRKVKAAFDPGHLMNPEKVVNHFTTLSAP
jgi:glycolate oxidase